MTATNELTEALLKIAPERSDRQIAQDVGASPTTVGTVRKRTVQSGQLPEQTERLGADGRTRKVPPPKPAAKPAIESTGREVAVRSAEPEVIDSDAVEILDAPSRPDSVREFVRSVWGLDERVSLTNALGLDALPEMSADERVQMKQTLAGSRLVIDKLTKQIEEPQRAPGLAYAANVKLVRLHAKRIVAGLEHAALQKLHRDAKSAAIRGAVFQLDSTEAEELLHIVVQEFAAASPRQPT